MRLNIFFLIAAFAALAFAQRGMNEHGQVSQFQARIAVEDGTPLPHEPMVFVRNGMTIGCKVQQIFGNGTVIYTAWAFESNKTSDECPVQIRLDGFRTLTTTLHDNATVTLKRLGENEGVVTPASSISAPKNAAKAYAKGAEALRKGNFAEAEKQFQSAVSEYPEYAQAYSDLGEALEKQKKFPEAQAAYDKALALSPKYLKPYAQLARLELARNGVDRALEITDRAVKLSPIDMPSIYYYRALALRQKGQLPEAEAAIKQAIEGDADRQLPRASYLLGLILEAKGDHKGAAEAFEFYSKWTPKPADAEEAAARAAKLKSL